MRIEQPSYEIITPIDGEAILRHIERCGRVCYKSGDKADSSSAHKFIQSIIRNGHESVLEHFSITVHIVCDRGVMVELTRHRIASFSVESSRYCNYSKDKFGNEITVIEPCFWKEKPEMRDTWEASCTAAEAAYFCFLEHGAKPEEARAVLPMSLKTEVICTANLREWRTIFSLRADKHAHPQMQQIMIPILYEFAEKIPVVFDDIAERIRKQNETDL